MPKSLTSNIQLWKIIMNDTRQLALESMAGEAAILRTQCLEQLTEYGPMTADEIANRLGRSPLSIRPRISELNKRRRIADTGDRRENHSGRSAKVWSIAA